MSTGSPNQDQGHLADPDKVAPMDPGKCPKPDGCKCVWTPLNHGWLRGHNNRCTVH